MVRLDFHARVQTGNIFCGKHDAFRAVRSSEGRRSSVPVAWHGSLLLILRTISPRDYESRTCRREKKARVKTLCFDMAFADEAPRWKNTRPDSMICSVCRRSFQQWHCRGVGKCTSYFLLRTRSDRFERETMCQEHDGKHVLQWCGATLRHRVVLSALVSARPYRRCLQRG